MQGRNQDPDFPPLPDSFKTRSARSLVICKVFCVIGDAQHRRRARGEVRGRRYRGEWRGDKERLELRRLSETEHLETRNLFRGGD